MSEKSLRQVAGKILGGRGLRAHPRRRVDRQTARGLRAGADHYMAYVGPPDEYDLMGAMQFRLLATLGMREFHNVLDFGCGSLRLGRLLLAYLEPGRFTGLEPNQWLIEEGIAKELGKDIVRVKQPNFFYNEDFDASRCGGPFDFIIAQSIFSHTAIDLMETTIASMAKVVAPNGLIIFNALHTSPTQPRFEGSGWAYPKIVAMEPPEIGAVLDRIGLAWRQIPFFHPRLHWYVASPDAAQIPDASLDAHLSGGTLRVEDYRASTQ